MIKLANADLNYLLQQANILNDYTRLTSAIDPNGVREVSGSNNNLVGGYTVLTDGSIVWTGNTIHPDWGQADTEFLRIFQTNHPTEDPYGTTYAPVEQAEVTINTAAGPVTILVNNPMAIDPALLVADTNGLLPTDAGYIPTLADYPKEYQVGTIGAAPASASSSVVQDSSVRLISELVASSNVDTTDPNHNPAAVAAMERLGGNAEAVSNSVVGDVSTAFMPNPGILGGVTYNEWFVAFGQFFDHGLDFIQKGAGVVMIPLSPNDPLWIDPADPQYIPGVSNVMMLSRAQLANPDTDFTAGQLNAGVTPQFNNNTGLMIDQSQTYGSHETINVLVRQYDANGALTGHLIDGGEDGSGDVHELATWADMKANAMRLGIELLDSDVLDAPMILADAIGRYTFTAQQTNMYRSDETLAEMATRTGVAEATLELNDPFVRWTMADSLNGLVDSSEIGTVRMTNQAILLDIAHGADPSSAGYDAALLARHKVSGDGRVNENITLTAVHHVFHEEHNIQADQIKLASIEDAIATGDLAMLNGDGAREGWLAVDVDQTTFDGLVAMYGTDYQSIADALTWDGEKIYQAARVVVESEYNHIAIDQYMGGLYPALPEFVSYSSDINLNVSLEFAQAVFRLGHSQLRETVQIAVQDGNGINPGEPGYTPTYTEEGLFNVFLNPDAYDQYGASGIVAGLLTQQGNEMDEFVTAALQQSLVGAPLDLAALNLARGRDVGLPTLNELRQQVFDGLTMNTANNSNGSGLAPYHSWEDFGAHLRNPESLVNFIAAYGRDDAGTFGLEAARDAYQAGTGELFEVRDAAQVILDAAADANHTLHSEAVMFMQGAGEPIYDPATGTWDVATDNGGDLGYWDIDLWLGGLAEQPLFDGPLGTTFSFILLDFAQRMQDGDRFYYLYRMPVGHHLGDQIIGEQFADLVMRTTGLEHIPDAFGTPSGTYTLDGYDSSGAYIDNPRDGVGAADNYGDNDYFNATLESLPDVTSSVALLNSGFEDPLSAPPAVVSNANGTYQNGAPQGWTLSGAGGTWDPSDIPVPFNSDSSANTGVDQVAYLGTNAVLTQDVATQLIEGAIYTLTFEVGDRLDRIGIGGTARLLDENGVVLGTFNFQPPVDDGDAMTDDAWNMVTVMTGPIDAASAGLGLTIEITTGAVGEQTLVDNVSLYATEAGGSANDGHITVIGLSGNDFIVGALGDDVLYGDAGNDVIEGAQGNDHIYGGDGDDYITDYENDDFISGGAGNDSIFAGPGVLDTIHGNEGDDELHGGDGIDEVFGDDGNDRLYGEGDTDLMIGGDGDDFMDGGDGVDEMFAGNGNDWLRGGVGDDNMNGGSGNDLIEGGLGPTANDGDRLNGDSAPGVLPVIEYNGDGSIGDMDIGSYEESSISVVASLQTSNNAGTSSNLLDTYALIDGLVGSQFDDILEGGEVDAIALNGSANQLIGGAGNDRLIGLGDNDIIVGDMAVVRNNLWINIDATVTGLGYTLWDDGNGNNDWYGTGEVRPIFDDTGEIGHILGDNGAAGIDTAVYRGDAADYNITGDDLGVVTVEDTRAIPADPQTGNHDGTDTLIGIEKLEFNGATYNLTVGTAGNDNGAAGRIDGTAGSDVLLGLSGNDQLRGLGGADIIVGGAGNDNVNAGGGNDTIIWNVGDGTDVVNGGGGNQDTFIVNGDGTGNYAIVAVSPNNAGFRTYYEGLLGVTLQAATTMIVLRDGALIAQLRNIEELVVDMTNVSANDGNGIPNPGVNVSVTGDFTDTGLNYSTITIIGDDGDDTVDISGLTSDHRIVFEGGGGTNTVIGAERSQDVLSNAGYEGGQTGSSSEEEDGSETSDTSSSDTEEESESQETSGSEDDSEDNSESTSEDSSSEDTTSEGEAEDEGEQEDEAEYEDEQEDEDGHEDSEHHDGQVIFSDDEGDTIVASDDDDLVFGGGGNDNIVGEDGDDMLFGDEGEDRILGGDGDDVIEGGDDDDTVFAGEGDDTVIATEGDGNDTYRGDDGVDTLDYAAISADVEVDLGGGLLGHGSVVIGEETDTIYGFENVVTGSGNDKIVAGSSANVMDGGDGNDTFVFGSVEDADGDMILGFAPGDTIDLSGIDADTGTDGHQSFTLVTGCGFSAAGELTIMHEEREDGSYTVVAGNVSGGNEADFKIDIAGHHSLTDADFTGVS